MGSGPPYPGGARRARFRHRVSRRRQFRTHTQSPSGWRRSRISLPKVGSGGALELDSRDKLTALAVRTFGHPAAQPRRSPLASQRDRTRQASSAPESPRLEPSAYPSPPTSRPRSLVGPSAATSALASLSTSCPDLGQRHASVSPPTTRKYLALFTMTSPRCGEEERGGSASPRSASALPESAKDVRRTSAGMPHLVNTHFDDISEWDGGGGTIVTNSRKDATWPKEEAAVGGAYSRVTKPKRPSLDIAAGPSAPSHSISMSPTATTMKASSAPVTATEMHEETEMPRRIRTQTDRERISFL